MADQLLLVNPRRRKRRTTTRKRARTRAGRYTRRRRNPRPSYVSGSTVVRAPATNPRRRRRRTTYKKRRRRNPRRRGFGTLRIANIFQDTVMPAAMAAGGAIGLDIIWGMLPIPLALKTGPMRFVAKGIGAVAMGMVSSMVVDQATAKNFTAGAMTVVMYDALREALQTWMPQLALSAYDINDTLGYPSSAMDVGSESDLSAYFPGQGNNAGAGNMGAYFPQDMSMGDYEDVDVFI